jgi:outer membrane protein OmpA-like peptidoglycan-associated protein
MNVTEKKILKSHRRKLRIEAKRSVELWIYSFADMYMILVVFFIAMAAVYAVKAKKAIDIPPSALVKANPSTAGRGPAVAESLVSIGFERGSADLGPQAFDDLNVLVTLVKSSPSALVDVEGYADSSAIAKDSPFSSNLELSSLRAVHVAEWLMKQGVSPARVRTYAYGNGQTWAGRDSNVKSDRRVVVKFFLKGTGGSGR